MDRNYSKEATYLAAQRYGHCQRREMSAPNLTAKTPGQLPHERADSRRQPTCEDTMAAEPRWRCHIEGDSPFHVWPLNDGVEHDIEDDDGNCVCGPAIEPVEGHDGYIGWLITHHSLDGREQQEQARANGAT